MNGGDVRNLVLAGLGLAATLALGHAVLRGRPGPNVARPSPIALTGSAAMGLVLIALAFLLGAGGWREPWVTTPGRFAAGAHGWSMAVAGLTAGLFGLLFLLIPLAHIVRQRRRHESSHE